MLMQTDETKRNFVTALQYLASTKFAGNRIALADAAGIHESYLSLVLSGRRSASLEVKMKLAEACGYTYENFLRYGKAIEGTVGKFQDLSSFKPERDEPAEKSISEPPPPVMLKTAPPMPDDAVLAMRMLSDLFIQGHGDAARQALENVRDGKTPPPPTDNPKAEKIAQMLAEMDDEAIDQMFRCAQSEIEKVRLKREIERLRTDREKRSA